LTAAWEQQLKEVEEGTGDAAAFYRDIVALVCDLVPRVATGPAMTAEQVAAAQPGGTRSGGRDPGGRGKARRGKGGRSQAGQDDSPAAASVERPAGPRPAGLGPCPLCGADLLETPRAFGCSRYREGCGFAVWKELAGVTLAKRQVERLLRLGVTERIEGFRAKSGRTFGARVRLGEGGKVGFDFSDAPEAEVQPARPGGTPEPARAPTSSPPTGPASAAAVFLTCPKCGLGQIIEGRRGFGCDRYREGCHFVVPKETGGKVLTQAQLRDLIQKGLTRPIKGLHDEAGVRRDGRLRLNGDWRVVVEPVAGGD
jgi:DNA topoisomerase-3